MAVAKCMHAHTLIAHRAILFLGDGNIKKNFGGQRAGNSFFTACQLQGKVTLRKPAIEHSGNFLCADLPNVPHTCPNLSYTLPLFACPSFRKVSPLPTQYHGFPYPPRSGKGQRGVGRLVRVSISDVRSRCGRVICGGPFRVREGVKVGEIRVNMIQNAQIFSLVPKTLAYCSTIHASYALYLTFRVGGWDEVS